MPYSNYAKKNKEQKHPKVNINQYLSSSGEPRDVMSHDIAFEIETEILEDNYFVKRRFRQNAHKIRKDYF